MNKLSLFFAALYYFALPVNALAEPPTCSGSTYAEPTCGGTCAQSYCQDVSFAQDGSVFQCCISEMPKVLLYGLLLIVSFRLMLRRAKRKTILGVAASANG